MEPEHEPANLYQVGAFKGSVAIGRSVHRVLTQKAAIALAYWLVKECPTQSTESRQALAQLTQYLLDRAKQDSGGE